MDVGGTVISTTYSEMAHQKMNYAYICTCIFGVSERETEKYLERDIWREKDRQREKQRNRKRQGRRDWERGMTKK